MAYCSNNIYCSGLVFCFFFMHLEKVRLFFIALGGLAACPVLDHDVLGCLLGISYSLLQVYRWMRITQLELFQFHENIGVFYLWYPVVHGFLFSLIMFKSKGNTHWKNCTQCYWSPSSQQDKATARISFLIIVHAGI